jgi:diguanylate cyclase (GGDEF)-like protein
MPMMAHGEALGVLYIAQSRAGGFTEAKQQVARTVAEQISLALANLQLQETLRTQSIRDPLTGLFNRRYMEASLEREMHRSLRRSHPLSIIMLDIDHFKRFNDTFGHDAGDALLSEFGRFLATQVRGEDIACRYGGEEFMLILPDASVEVAAQRAERLREAARQINVQHRRQTLEAITISIGVASVPNHAADGEELMRAADTALYAAKRQGRDRVVVANATPQDMPVNAG